MLFSYWEDGNKYKPNLATHHQVKEKIIDEARMTSCIVRE